jgi:hypothetical protein
MTARRPIHDPPVGPSAGIRPSVTGIALPVGPSMTTRRPICDVHCTFVALVVLLVTKITTSTEWEETGLDAYSNDLYKLLAHPLENICAT